ncbi:SDR family oxidoreductase [Paraliomyxa miuraensis]|uniref:SDR family oxidoreductase n=1 Tax=Paraliomyxa miuraensis TaxID=376150 RepID=UPI002253F759|nr:SDR family oxidoreductase [Paraliomyxa miuraensis]MCX4244102.1 SDR family oxidoreductase [Paraliomyxa miuraensis]
MKQQRTQRPEPPFPPQPLEPPGRESQMDPKPQWRAPHYHAAGKLEGRRCLVTGGDSGIGRAVAWLFAREGADVVITHLPEEAEDAQVVVEAIEGEGRRAFAIEVDLGDSDAAVAAVDHAAELLGGLDVVVNNAAYQRHLGSIEELELSQWRHTFETNIDAYFVVAKAALDHLPRGGVIINTGSITGLEGAGGLLDYSSTKGAIHAFTKSLAQQLVSRGIRVNCVAPGPVWTPLNPAERPHGGEHGYETFGQSVPYERPAQPEEIAPAYVFFASEADSGYITGEVLTLLGGQTRAS